MTVLTDFLKHSRSTLGVFYPTGYIIATFRSFRTAQDAVQKLRGAGHREEEIVALRASELLDFFDEFRATSGLWSGVMMFLSRSFGTEQVFADCDVQHAHRGAGFLAIYSPKEDEAARVRALLSPLEPLAMHWYSPGGVHVLI